VWLGEDVFLLGMGRLVIIDYLVIPLYPDPAAMVFYV
jgi:hypothetical protein